MKKIDELLNGITMYRLVLYTLAGYTGLAAIFAIMGVLSFTATALMGSLILLLGSAFIVDKLCSRLFKVPNNSESWLITSLILLLVLQPADSIVSGLTLVLAGAVASASKYLVNWNGKHIFNPAALAATLLSLTDLQPTTWWIGNSHFWPFTLIVGLAVVRKIRRYPLFLTFVGIAAGLQLALFVVQGQPIATGMKDALLASPLIFLATIMITEPATMPPRRRQQLIFAGLAAVLYVMAWKVGPVVVYPEVALLIANIYAFIVAPKFRVRLRLQEIQRVSDRVFNYVFQPDRPFTFLPGQYMEWTLAGVPYDSRGNRRTFTIASSPTEPDVHLGLKYYQPASMYKATFAQLRPGDYVYGSQLAGNFTLDPDGHKKLAFIAGGIGITPFRSMVKYLTDNKITRDVVLLYMVAHPDDLAYQEDIKAAAAVGVRCVPVVTLPGYKAPGIISAKLSQQLLARYIPDYAERVFYISGSNRMVRATETCVQALGVPATHIKTDYFSGY